MRVILFGYDPQWQQIVASDCVVNINSNIQDLAMASYDAIVACSDDLRLTQNIIRYALVNHKHILITQPLWGTEDLYRLARNSGVACHTAFNYSLDTKVLRLQKLLQAGHLGEVYHCRVQAATTSNNAGVLTTLGPHVLYLLHALLGKKIAMSHFNILSKKAYKADFLDHAVIADFTNNCSIEIELTALINDDRLSWEITTSQTYESAQLIYNPNSLWSLEYANFKSLCSQTNTVNDYTIEQSVVSEIERLNTEEILIA